MNNIGIIIQARVGSSRLPNKIIMPFYNNYGILELLIKRFKAHDINIPIIVATTRNKEDNIIQTIAERNNVYYYRGNESNVLLRFINAANKYNINKIIRVCADNPFIDIYDLRKLYTSIKNHDDIDYWCYSSRSNKPSIKMHIGLWCEGVTLKALKYIINVTNDNYYLEHVTNYIYENKKLFNIKYIYIEKPYIKYSNIRLTVDSINDFYILKKLYCEMHIKNIPIKFDKILKTIHENDILLHEMKKQIILNKK